MPIRATEPVHLPRRIRVPFAYPSSLFPIPSNKDTYVDIGPGRGDFLFHLARTYPNATIVGIEIKSKRVDKIIKRIERFGLKNVIIVQADAKTMIQSLTTTFCSNVIDCHPEHERRISNIIKKQTPSPNDLVGDSSPSVQNDKHDTCGSKPNIKEIYISFPDPWPKKRHSKNRILEKDFLTSCANTLATNGKLVITTDVKEYAEQTLNEIDLNLLRPEFTPTIKENAKDVFPTFFAEKWKAMGRNSYIQSYIKR